jgi:hypothetical protein
MREPSPYAGQTVRLRADATELGGHDAEIVDWYENTTGGVNWLAMAEQRDVKAEGYAIRRALGGMPNDGNVLMARVDGMGQLVHLTEIEGASVPPNTGGPSPVDPRAVGQPCPACQVPLADDDKVAVIRLGPGANPAARAAARAGLPYECVHAELHWACATGDESYSTTEV